MVQAIYEKPEYWCGNFGYRPPGYADFCIHTIKELIIMMYKPESVLDIGCAYGFSIARLRALGIDAWGIDISSLALSRCPVEEFKQYLICTPAWQLPFPDHDIDFAFSSGVFEHIPEDNLGQSISELKRVCRRGLIGIAVSDDETSKVNEDVSHENLRSLSEWRKLLPSEFNVISDSEASWRIYSLTLMRELMRRIETI